jgi:hypothetical protein
MLIIGEPLGCLLVLSLIEFVYGWMEFGTDSNVGELEDGDLRYHEDRTGHSFDGRSSKKCWDIRYFLFYYLPISR